MKQLPVTGMQQAEFARTVWDATPPAGTTLDDMMDPAYWVHVAAKLKPWDRIEVRAEDGTWYAELVVRMATRTAAVVAQVHYVQLGAPATVAKADDIYEVEFKPAQRWRVRRLSDGIVMSSDHATREEATRAMMALPRPLKAAVKAPTAKAAAA